MYIGTLKVCNVRYILSYKLQHMNFTPETQSSIAFYCRVSRECSFVVYEVSRWYHMLTCMRNSSKHIHHFIWGNHIQQLIIPKVIMIETICKQF